MMFKVEDQERKVLMLAPLTTLGRIFDLSPGAIRRIEVETCNGRACDLHFSKSSDPWPMVYITRLPLEIPVPETASSENLENFAREIGELLEAE